MSRLKIISTTSGNKYSSAMKARQGTPIVIGVVIWLAINALKTKLGVNEISNTMYYLNHLLIQLKKSKIYHQNLIS
jgi:hypothetical protein